MNFYGNEIEDMFLRRNSIAFEKRSTYVRKRKNISNKIFNDSFSKKANC